MHFSEHAISLGVPAEAITVEPRATNTGQNITLTREALAAAGIEPESVLLICKPYMERLPRALCRIRLILPTS